MQDNSPSLIIENHPKKPQVLLNHCGQWQTHLRARPHEHGLSRSKHLLILSLYNSVILFLKACLIATGLN